MENIFCHYAAGESLYTAMVEPVCKQHGLTYMEFTVLMFLANNPQFDTAADIVRFRRLTKSHVSMSVRGLEDKGLLRGRLHSPDRRSIHLTVSDAAEGIVKDGRAAQQRFGEILLTGFSPDEAQMLLSFMQRIDENITAHLALEKEKKG